MSNDNAAEASSMEQPPEVDADNGELDSEDGKIKDGAPSADWLPESAPPTESETGPVL
jgi:hypothetical protein